MAQCSSWEVNIPQQCKKFPAFYGNRRFSSSSKSARCLSLSWTRSVYSLAPSHFLQIHLNYSTHLILCPLNGLFPSSSLPKPSKNLSSPTFYMSAHLTLFDFITLIKCSEHYRSLSSSLCSFLHSHVTSPSWDQIFSSAPYCQVRTARFPPSVWATRFHTHNISKIKILYILIFVFFGRQISAQNDSNHSLTSICP